MRYTITTLNKSTISQKINETDERPFIVLPFAVKELNYSDSIMIRKEDFTAAIAKNAIKVKIQEYLGKLAEHTEFTIEV